MQKSTKGAVAAAVAGALLLGGAGSLAYWSDSDDVAGGGFTAGSLNLVAADACNVWNLDTGEPGGQPFDILTGTIVPGDVLTKVCNFDIDAVGEHLRATVTATPGTDSGDLLTELDIATALEVNGATRTEITEADHAQQLEVTVTVTFDPASTNTSQTDTAVLDDIAIVTAQVHS